MLDKKDVFPAPAVRPEGGDPRQPKRPPNAAGDVVESQNSAGGGDEQGSSAQSPTTKTDDKMMTTTTKRGQSSGTKNDKGKEKEKVVSAELRGLLSREIITMK